MGFPEVIISTFVENQSSRCQDSSGNPKRAGGRQKTSLSIAMNWTLPNEPGKSMGIHFWYSLVIPIQSPDPCRQGTTSRKK